MLAELENLFALQDKNYREFHARLMPNIEKERIIGIRVPVLRKYAKELAHGSRLFLSVQKEKWVCNIVKENDCDNVEKFLICFRCGKNPFQGVLCKHDEGMVYRYGTCKAV